MVHKRFLGCLAVALITMTGCDQEQPIEMDTTTAVSEEQKQSIDDNDPVETDNVAAIYSDIYEEAIQTNALGSVDLVRTL